MSAAVALAIVVIIVAAIATVALVAFRIVSAQRTTAPVAPYGLGPEYKHRPETVKYYGQPVSQPSNPPDADTRPTSSDPRHAPLPRCPACGVAIAFGDEKCPRCGLGLKAT